MSQVPKKATSPKIKVSYYNKDHEQLLLQTPNADKIIKLVEKGYYLNEDFWVYSVFTDQAGYDGFKTFDDLSSLWIDQYKYTGRYFDLENKTIKAKLPSDKYRGSQLTERIGVAGGLSLVSYIHDLTEADWRVIPITGTKDLDFEIASDGKNIVEVECKGSFAKDNNISSSISNHKSDIEEKKKEQRRLGNKNVLYGVITSFSDDENIIAHSRLLDPESYTEYDDPYKSRILSRLGFYLIEIRKFSRSHFLIALANRISVIQASTKDSYKSFNKLPLINAKEEIFNYPISLENNKSIITSSTDNGFGDVLIHNDEYFVFGFDREIIEMLIKQDFEELVGYKKIPKTFPAVIEAKIKKADKFMSITLHGNLQMNSAGRIVGVANISKKDIEYS